MKKLHHSTTDWDFMSDAWILDNAIYVGAPSSLQFYDYDNVVLCRFGPTLDLVQGRIITWVRWWASDGYTPLIIFRNQRALDWANLYDCYYINWATAHVRLFRRVANDPTEIANALYTLPINTWVKWRITWWNTFDYQNKACIRVCVERWDAPDWTVLGTWDDTVNAFVDSEINRVGIGLDGTASAKAWFDDTEIWAPAE